MVAGFTWVLRYLQGHHNRHDDVSLRRRFNNLSQGKRKSDGLALHHGRYLAYGHPARGKDSDHATGLDTINVTNLIDGWKETFTSTMVFSARTTSITAAHSTILAATGTGRYQQGPHIQLLRSHACSRLANAPGSSIGLSPTSTGVVSQ